MSDSAKLSVPTTGDNGKILLYNESTDKWDLSSSGSLRTIVTPEASGAAGNAVTITDGAVTSGSATFTSASSVFTGRSGQVIVIAGAGASGATLTTTILSVNSATSIQLNTNASTTVTNAIATYGTNDTSALATWFGLASASKELRVTPGASYLHSGTVTMTGKSNVLLDLRGATFKATAPATSAIKFVSCNGLEIRGGTFELTPPPTTRLGTENDYKLYFQQCNRVRTYGLYAKNSASASTLLLNCTDFEFYDPINESSLADGFHMTGGSSYGRVIRPVSIGVGDDGVAVVSYNTGEAISHDIDVISPRIYNQTGGRGITVVGGSNVTFVDVEIDSSYGAAIYIANESSFTSYPSNKIRVSGGRILNANTNTGLDHGAVLVYNSINGTNIGNVTVEDLEITNTRSAAGGSLQLKKAGSTGTMSGILFKNIRLLGTGPATNFNADSGLSATQTNVTRVPGWYHIGARVYRNSTQSVPNTTLTTMSFNTERWDDGDLWVVGTPTRLTIPVAGVYRFGAVFEIDQPLNDSRTVYSDIFLNGTTIIGEGSGSGFRTTGNTGDTIVLSAQCEWKCAAGDYVESRIYQNSGSTCTVAAGTSTDAKANDFWAELVSVS